MTKKIKMFKTRRQVRKEGTHMSIKKIKMKMKQLEGEKE